MKKFTDKILICLLLLVSISALAIAFGAQFIFGFEPCILCNYQRIPYFSVILFAGLALHIESADRSGIAKAIGVIFLTGAALAFYHSGVEQHWWEAATSCGSSGVDLSSFQDFQTKLLIKMPKACDQIDWTLFDLSMTVYNTFASLAFAALSFFGTFLIRKLYSVDHLEN